MRKQTNKNKRQETLVAIRKQCLNCVSHSTKEVAKCSAKPRVRGKAFACPLWEHRFGDWIKSPRNYPPTAIRKHCLQCMGGSREDVERCEAAPGTKFACPLWPYRMGPSAK